jgi:uncharacterized UPF0160 family protein
MEKIKIVTHNLGYHADDVFSCAALSLILEKDKKEFEIIRTRDPEIIKSGDYVVDVGGEYDESNNRFDHHQKGGAGKRENGIPYASFGLVWKKYGEIISGSRHVSERIDKKLVSPIDAIDNGVEISKSITEGVSDYSVQNIFGILQPTWNEPFENVEAAFYEALPIAKKILQREIIITQSIMLAEQKVKEAYENAPDKRLIVLDKHYPVGDFLLNFPEVLYIVRPRGESGETWGVKAVQKNSGSFENRKNLPQAWAGLRDEELQKITGVDDAIFCHNAMFLAVAKSKEGAIKLAQLALEN